MRVRRPNFAVFLFLVLFCSAGVSSARSSTQKHATHKQPPPETTVEVVPPPPPPPPPRPEQMPAVAPQVTFQNGKLTIIARNSTLGDILRAVHTKTGANIELSGSATERVVGMFGPGPSRDVMTSLLNGSHFNYVMLGSEASPDQLQRLILTPKGVDGATTPAPPPEPVEAQNQPDAQPAPDGQDPNSADDLTDDSADADAAAADNAVEDPNAQGQQVGQPNAKTPEQMLLELQRQQQIQQQQQQQQGGAPPPGQGFPPGAPGVAPQPPH